MIPRTKLREVKHNVQARLAPIGQLPRVGITLRGTVMIQVPSDSASHTVREHVPETIDGVPIEIEIRPNRIEAAEE